MEALSDLRFFAIFSLIVGLSVGGSSCASNQAAAALSNASNSSVESGITITVVSPTKFVGTAKPISFNISANDSKSANAPKLTLALTDPTLGTINGQTITFNRILAPNCLAKEVAEVVVTATSNDGSRTNTQSISLTIGNTWCGLPPIIDIGTPYYWWFSRVAVADGVLWASNGNSIFHFDEQTSTWIQKIDRSIGLGRAVVKDLISDGAHSNIWASFDIGGAGKLFYSVGGALKGTWNGLISSNNLNQHIVRSIAISTNLIALAYGGSPSAETFDFTQLNSRFNIVPKMPLNISFAATAFDNRGGVWFGESGGTIFSGKGIIYRFDPITSAVTTYDQSNWGSAAYADVQTASANAATGEIWFGLQSGFFSDNGGIVVASPSGSQGYTFKYYGAANGLTNTYVYAIAHTNNDGVWVGTDGGGLTQFSNGSFGLPFTSENTNAELPSNNIYGMAYAPDAINGDIIWCITKSGVARLWLPGL